MKRLLRRFKNRQTATDSSTIPESRTPANTATTAVHRYQSSPGVVFVHSTLSAEAPQTTTSVFSAVKSGVGLATSAADAFPPLKSVLGALSYILMHHEKWLKNKDDVERLIERMKNLQDMVQEGEIGTNEGIQRRKLREKFQSIADDLEALKTKSVSQKYIAAQDDAEKVAGLLEDVRECIMDYQTAILNEVVSQIAKHMSADDHRILQTLPRAEDASHFAEKHNTCLRGTRTEIMESLEAWASDPSALSLYWLNGHAGSGKSTIAQSFCQRAFADGMLGGSFFCSRSQTSRSDLQMIFPTLSFQLACRFSAFRTHVVKVLKDRPDVGRESLSNQLTMLLIQPLQATGLSTLIVIDALDECKDSESTSAILSLLARHIDSIPNVKWFITGRPEPRIRSGFRLTALRPITEIFVLHDIDSSAVDRDIELYLRTRLSDGVKGRSDLELSIPWPSDADIDILKAKAGQLFIFAATAVSFILSPIHQPSQRLALLNQIPDSSAHEGRSGIDDLYTTILEDGYGSSEPSDHAQLRRILGTIVLALNPLSTADLALLLNLDAATICSSLRPFHALVRIPKDTSCPIKIYHQSFPDYLLDSNRCRNPQIHIDPAAYHRMLAEDCLRFMNVKLKKNICSLPRYALNQHLALNERRRRVGGVLEYASLWWSVHLLKAEILLSHDSLLRALKEFLTLKQVLWLEVLSVLECLQTAVNSLENAHGMLLSVTMHFRETNGDLAELAKWITDGQRFVLEFRECIEPSAPHIYHSALPLAPNMSLLRILHSQDLENEAYVVHGNEDRWPPSQLTLNYQLGDSFPNFSTALQFANEGHLLAFPGRSSIQLVDVVIGRQLLTLQWARTPTIAISPDDSLLLCACNGVYPRILDIQTGEHIKKLSSSSISPSSDYRAAQFSPDGSLIAIRDDRDVCFWGVFAGDLQLCLPLGEWESGLFITDFAWLEGESLRGVFLKSRFSRGARHPDNSMLEILDFTDGRVTKTTLCPFPVIQIAVSNEHGLIACDGGARLVLFDASITRVLSTSTKHSDGDDSSPAPLVFSPREPLLYWARQIFDFSDVLEIKPLTPPLVRVRALAFSPVQNILATIDSSSVIRLWPSDCIDLQVHNKVERAPKLFISPDAKTVIWFGTTKRSSMKFCLGERVASSMLAEHDEDGNELLEANFPLVHPAAALHLFSDGREAILRPTSSEIDLSSRHTSADPSQSPAAYTPTAYDFFVETPIRPGRFIYYQPMDEGASVLLSIKIRVDMSGSTPDLEAVRFPDTANGQQAIVYKEPRRLPVYRRFHEEWLDVDHVNSVWMLHNTLEIHGCWRVATPSSPAATYFDLVADDSFPTDVEVTQRLRELTTYPVITSGRGWIYNGQGQPILWVPYRAQASREFSWKWRWAGRRLIIAGDGDIASPFILDFKGVELAIPTAADTYREMRYRTIILHGLDKAQTERAARAQRQRSGMQEQGAEETNKEEKSAT